MEYAEFIRQTPLRRPCHFNAAEEIQESMSHVGLSGLDLRQLGKGPFRSDWAVIEAGNGTLFSGRYNKDFSLHLRPPGNQVGILACVSANGTLLASGKNVANSRMLFLPEGSHTDIIAPPLAGAEAITLPADRFREAVHALVPNARAFVHTTVTTGCSRRLGALRREMLELMGNPAQDMPGERLASLIAEIILWIASSAPPDRVDTANAPARIAKTAQNYLESNFREAFRMEDLCRETKLGARTVQRCFREYFDLTISAYVKTLRLCAAHRALRVGQSGRTSVATVAHANGFAHLGRFSVEFRQRFGKTPSQTLAETVVRKRSPSRQADSSHQG